MIRQEPQINYTILEHIEVELQYNMLEIAHSHRSVLRPNEEMNIFYNFT